MDDRADTRPAAGIYRQGRHETEQAEIDRLRKEAAKLKMERDILKKAAAYLARESM